MKPKRIIVGFTAVAMAVVAAVLAWPDKPRQGKSFTRLERVASQAGFCKLQTPTARGTVPFVAVCAEGSTKLSCLTAIKESGGRVIGPFAPDALLVELGAKMLERVRADSRFASVRELAPDEKVAEGYVEGPATIVALTDGDAKRIGEFVVESGGKLIEAEHTPTEVKATLPKSLIPALTKRGEVRGIRGEDGKRLENAGL